MNANATDTTGTTLYEIRAIDPEVLKGLRVRDDAGNPPRLVVEDDEGGSPMRCCLGRSEPGETLALVSYAPLRRWAARTGAQPGPYNEVGPVFIHPEDCGGPKPGNPGSNVGGYPDTFAGDRRVLRAYSADGDILGGLLLDGGEMTIDQGLAKLYADPRVAVVHVRAVEFGCFHAETRRA